MHKLELETHPTKHGGHLRAHASLDRRQSGSTQTPVRCCTHIPEQTPECSGTGATHPGRRRSDGSRQTVVQCCTIIPSSRHQNFQALEPNIRTDAGAAPGKNTAAVKSRADAGTFSSRIQAVRTHAEAA